MFKNLMDSIAVLARFFVQALFLPAGAEGGRVRVGSIRLPAEY